MAVELAKLEAMGQDQVHTRYPKYTPREQMELISWYSLETMLLLTFVLFATYLIYNKCQEINDPLGKIPTRREELVAESSVVITANDMEMRKQEYIKRKRGQKFPPTCLDGSETLPHTPIDQSFIP